MRTAYKSFLKCVSGILAVIAGLSFFWGGHAISDFFKIDRIFAEILGLGIAVICGAISFAVNNALDDTAVIEENERLARQEQTGKQR